MTQESAAGLQRPENASSQRGREQLWKITTKVLVAVKLAEWRKQQILSATSGRRAKPDDKGCKAADNAGKKMEATHATGGLDRRAIGKPETPRFRPEWLPK
jgi:hypothetical protein